jgi:hypothetical protein
MGHTQQEVRDDDAQRSRCPAWLHWCVLIFAMIFPAIMAWIYFVVLAQPPQGGGSGVLAPVAYGLSKTVQFAFPVVWLWRFGRDRLQPGWPSFRGLRIGLGFGLLVAALILGAYFGILRGHRFLAGTPASVLAKVTQLHVATPGRFVLLAIFLSGIHSLMEEYYWRWFVFAELRRFLRVTPAIFLSSAAFMLHHVIILGVYFPERFFEAALPFSLCVAAGGAAWAWLYERTGTIYSSWLSHLLIDAAIMAVGYDMVFVYGR